MLVMRFTHNSYALDRINQSGDRNAGILFELLLEARVLQGGPGVWALIRVTWETAKPSCGTKSRPVFGTSSLGSREPNFRQEEVIGPL